ncbi:metal ABC transporter permease [Vibrio parahaemolyticus]|nr:ABC transporter [Vibrio parahaemolyticus]PMT76670.1 metal ABC transporter permease [Vibrio parahaemolyticus]PMT81902.1 metal ABC transporter permease [Vibrio parahaemolyticus]TNY56915.1 metal ABC transporter permease [Vibrio parahaemolyticus]TOD80244.1 metal ABC transporter permease [Vibrio parahaemolyticus]
MIMTEYTWLAPAILCGVIALVGNVVLGQQVLKRQIIFIDLAVAQVAALGAALSHYWLNSSTLYVRIPWLSESWLGAMLGPWIMSLLLCGLIAALEKRNHPHLEPMIGSLFVVSASLAVLLVSKDPHGADFIQGILNGQLLWSTWQDVWPLTVITGAMLLLVRTKPEFMRGSGFYLIFAILMPITVKLMGIYLEFALLVIPALCAASLTGRRFLTASLGIGTIGILLGIAASAKYDLPSGATIVITLFMTGLVFNIFSPLRKIVLLQMKS